MTWNVLLIDLRFEFAVGMMNRDGSVRGAADVVAVGDSDLVHASGGDRWPEGCGLLAFASIAVMQIAATNVRRCVA